MDWTVACPACGGAGKVERDAFGNETVTCDAFDRCTDGELTAAREGQEAGVPDWMIRQEMERHRAHRLRVVRSAPLFDGDAS